MIRKLAIVAVALAILGAVAAWAAPALVLRFGEHKIDQALAKVGFETTSAVRRGDVSVDLWSWTVSVSSIEISGAGRGSMVSIGRLTVTRPSDAGGRLTAERVVVDDLKIDAPGETVSVPRAEIVGYSGPERGLTATPGLDRERTTQADLIAKVSIDRITAPAVISMGEKVKVRRMITNVVIDDIRDGVIKTVTADAVTVQAPFLEPGAPAASSSLLVSAKSLFYKGFNVPALLRLYVGDPASRRERLVEVASASEVQAFATTRPGGRITASVGEIRVEDVGVRALNFPFGAFDPVATVMRIGEEATPRQIRDQLSFAVDLSHAISFERFRLSDMKFNQTRLKAPRRTGSAASVLIGPYADARLGAIEFEAVAFSEDDGRRVALASGRAAGLDASNLVAHFQKVSRDEALLSAQPTAEEIVRTAPRIQSIEARGLDAKSAMGKLQVDQARIDVDAKLDAVPQHAELRLDGVNAKPLEGWPAQWVERLQLDGVKGSAAISLTFNPNDKTLSLDRLDYGVEGFGRVLASGKLEAVDPLLAVLSGAAFVDKFSSIRLAPVRIRLKDGGATAVLLRRAAEKAEQPTDEYREAFAKEVQDTLFRVLGPPGENSAESAARFIRDPREAEIMISPRNPDQPLLDLYQAFNLGPAGLAQVIDVAVLYRR